MNTYWLTCKEGPPFHEFQEDNIAWYADMQPVFMKKIS